MNFNNGGQGQQGICNQIYEPFMLGTSYGVGRNEPNPSMACSGFGGGPSGHHGYGRRGQQSSVRDCMNWPGQTYPAGNVAKLGGFNGGDSGAYGAPPVLTLQPQSFPQAQQPQAFVNNGQGEQPWSIPCQIGPLGTDPASLIQPLEPVTLRVTAPPPPPNENGVRGPVTFKISPEDLFRGNRR